MSFLARGINFFSNNLRTPPQLFPASGLFIIPLLLIVIVPVMLILAVASCIKSCFNSNNYRETNYPQTVRYDDYGYNSNYNSGTLWGWLFNSGPQAPYQGRTSTSSIHSTTGPTSAYVAPSGTNINSTPPPVHTAPTNSGYVNHRQSVSSSSNHSMPPVFRTQNVSTGYNRGPSNVSSSFFNSGQNVSSGFSGGPSHVSSSFNGPSHVSSSFSGGPSHISSSFGGH